MYHGINWILDIRYGCQKSFDSNTKKSKSSEVETGRYKLDLPKKRKKKETRKKNRISEHFKAEFVKVTE